MLSPAFPSLSYLLSLSLSLSLCALSLSECALYLSHCHCVSVLHSLPLSLPVPVGIIITQNHIADSFPEELKIATCRLIASQTLTAEESCDLFFYNLNL